MQPPEAGPSRERGTLPDVTVGGGPPPLVAQGVGIFLLIAIAMGISQFQLGAGLVWGGLAIVIVVMLLANTDKLLGIVATLQGK